MHYSLEQWNKLDRLEKIAWYWNKCNKELYVFQHKNFKFSLKIKFEELFSENETIQSDTIEALVKFLKCEKEYLINKNIILNVLKKKINKSIQLSDVNNFSNIGNRQKENIINLSSECVRKLNYII